MKNVFVSGGDKGIGKAVVEKLSKLKYRVIFTYNINVKGAKLIEKTYHQSYCYQCNFKNKENIKNTIKKILKKHKYIDIIINNAGSSSDDRFINMSEADWENIININLNSVFYFTQAFLPHMIKNNWGRIINITSIAAQKGAFGKTNYSAAKAGIIGFTKSLSLELASKGITVNAIAPGAINTDMYRSIPEKYRKKIIEDIPMNRLGLPEEIAELIYFLSSDNASYITGQVININGGSYLQ